MMSNLSPFFVSAADQGAVSMATLPKEPVLPEAAFIGRSNVGKSSLINMVCNRKVRRENTHKKKHSKKQQCSTI